MSPKRLLRFLVVAVLAGLVVIAAAAPAWAHATLDSSNPADQSQIAQSPPQITLDFSENVEIQLGAIRLFDCAGKRIETGAPHHGESNDHEVVVSIPKLDNDTYLVAWRVISADAHPVHGGFQFTVGQSSGQATCTAAATGKSSTTVGFLYGIARFALFTGLALLIGGGVFLVLIARGTSAAPRTRLLAWIGWAITLIATIGGIMLQGPYGEGTGIGDAFKVSVARDILHTHYGAIAELRLVLLALAIPALIFLRRADNRQRLPVWGLVGCSAVAILLAATPGLAGHADTGGETFFAIPLDTLHVLAMSVWLGGLVALIAGALGGAFSGSLRRAIVQFSQLALGAVIVLVVSGIFASWRQVGFDIRGYTDTSYGNMLLVKVGVVVVLVGVAAVSRSIVRKRQSAPLGAPDTVIAAVDEQTVGGLRKSVGIEVALGVAVLIVTALLVNAQPARSALAPKLFTTEVRAPGPGTDVLVDVIVDPAKSGPNTIHIYSLLPDGAPYPVTSMSATLALPSDGIDPVPVNLEKGGPNHWLANGVLIAPSGKWTLQIHLTKGQFTDIPAPPIEVPIR